MSKQPVEIEKSLNYVSLLYANWLKKGHGRRMDFTLRNFTPKLWSLERLHRSKLPVRHMKAWSK